MGGFGLITRLALEPPRETLDLAVLPEAVRSELEDLIRDCLKEDRGARREEVRLAWQQRAFKANRQHLYYDNASATFLPPSAASAQELPRYMDVYNIFTPHLRSMVSLLSQNPPGINFVPNDMKLGRDITAANFAERKRAQVDRLVHMKDCQMRVADLFGTDGRTIAWTRMEDGELRITLHGVLESKVPVYAPSMKHWGYAILSEERDAWEQKDEFPDFAKQISPGDVGVSEQQYERLARMNVMSSKGAYYGSGEGWRSMVTRHEAWIRPFRYRKLHADTEAVVREMFPDGVHATLVSGILVKAVPEAMDSVLRVAWPYPGDGQLRPSMLASLVPIQQAFNDALNLVREHGDYSIPARWITDQVDPEAVAEQVSAPGVTHQIAIPAGASVRDLVMTEDPLTLPAELIQNVDRLLELAQFTLGDTPSLHGMGTPDQQTMGGQALLNTQAKGQQSSPWASLQWLFAGVYELAIRHLCRANPFDPEAEAILEGVWRCRPDADDSFPETTADKRVMVQTVFTQLANVQGGQAIIAHPDNLKLFQAATGLDDLVIPGAEARDKQREEIEILLQEKPVPDDDAILEWITAGSQGPPPPPRSSVDIDPDWDYHADEADTVQAWLSSNACREELRRGNFAGIQNVRLHGQAHRAAMAAQAQAAQPPAVPPRVSLTAKVDDPSAISQLLGQTGVQANPEEIAAAAVPEQQNTAADTQLKQANAQHRAVLAARDQVTQGIDAANTAADTVLKRANAQHTAVLASIEQQNQQPNAQLRAAMARHKDVLAAREAQNLESPGEGE
jgi:hypothetical protein